MVVPDLQHELHADPVLYQPHHQVGFTLEHLVVFPGHRVGVLDREVKVWSWTKERKKVQCELQNYSSNIKSVCRNLN